MTCIIIDDEPLAREAIQLLVSKTGDLELKGIFNGPKAAASFLHDHPTDLIFLDIQMPGINGIDFARSIPPRTLVIFTTAFSEFALNSYEVEAIDYLIKPVQAERFQKAVEKAQSYHRLLTAQQVTSDVQSIASDYIFVKADRKTFRIYFKDILFIAGLKDYVVLHTVERQLITAMNVKTISDQLPAQLFLRTSKSYIINTQHVTSFDNNTVYIGKHEIPIGNVYRTSFFDEFVTKKNHSRPKL
jgi:DNA-binding LytR/AlgR family response regulator